MSLIKTIIESAAMVTRQSLKDSLPNLVKSANKLKDKLLSCLKNEYLPSDDVCKGFLEESNEFNEILKKVEADIQELLRNEENKVEDLLGNIDLAKLKFTVELNYNITIILNIASSFQNLQNACDDETCKKIVHMKKCFKNINLNENPDAFQYLIRLVKNCDRMVMKDIKKTIFDDIFFDEKVIKDKSEVKLFIKIPNDKMKSAFKSAIECGNDIDVEVISGILWDRMLSQIILKSTDGFVERWKYGVAYNLNIINKDKRDFYEDVVLRLKELFEFLNVNFNFELQETTILQIIGKEIEINLTEYLLKYCLQDAIISLNDKEKLAEAMLLMDSFEKILFDLKIFQEKRTPFSDYFQNVYSTYIWKYCSKFTDKAVKIMQEDLKITWKDPSNNFIISKSIPKLLDLITAMMKEAGSSKDDQFSTQLCITTKNILLKYPVVAQEFHQNILKSSAEHVALFYNNCCYINEDLTKTKWCEIFNNLPNLFNSVKLNYLQLFISSFSTKTLDNFIEQESIKIKKSVNRTTIKGSNIRDEIITKRLVDDGLKQQTLIKSSWYLIFKREIYYQSIGKIFNASCESLIDAICNLKIIKTEVAQSLTSILKIVEQHGMSLFDDSKNIEKYVHNWCKLLELSFILGAKLEAIESYRKKNQEEMKLSKDEVNALISAMFKNENNKLSSSDIS